jgi:hypothetical protein
VTLTCEHNKEPRRSASVKGEDFLDYLNGSLASQRTVVVSCDV